MQQLNGRAKCRAMAVRDERRAEPGAGYLPGYVGPAYRVRIIQASACGGAPTEASPLDCAEPSGGGVCPMSLRAVRWPIVAVLISSACSDAGPTGTDGDQFVSIQVDLVLPRGSLYVSDSVQLLLRGTREDGATITLHDAAWTSSNAGIASVGPSDHLIGRSRGRIEVTGTSRSGSGSAFVDVAGTLHRADVTTSETWSVDGSPHVVDTVLSVGGSSPVTLTIESGASVYFRDGAGLDVGLYGDGRLQAGGAGPQIVFAHEDSAAAPGSWKGLRFIGPGASVLSNAVIRGCGTPWDDQWPILGCVALRGAIDRASPELTVSDVHITEGVGFGFVADPGTRVGSGSHGLSVTSFSGSAGAAPADQLARFPYGGAFTDLEQPQFLIFGDTIEESLDWKPIGIPWVLLGDLLVQGSSGPTVTMAAGARVQFEYPASIIVGRDLPGVLHVGEASGDPVVLEMRPGIGAPTWGGIHLLEHSAGSTLVDVEMSDCGIGFRQACVAVVGGGSGVGPSTLMSDLTIRRSAAYGVSLAEGARFAPGSAGLDVSGSALAPLRLESGSVFTIPAGSYSANVQEVIVVTTLDVLTGDHRWLDHGVPYRVDGGLGIEHESNPILTLDPGVELQMGNGAGVFVGRLGPGTLRAIGTPSQPIRFRSSASASHPGYWLGFSFEELADPSTLLEHVIVEEAGATVVWSAAVYFHSDMGPVFRNSTIRRSGSCGVRRGPGGVWTTDFTDPSLANLFEENEGPHQCDS